MSVTFAANETDSASAALPQSQDTLDSILPTMLDALDDGFFYDLVERRRAWWDSARLKAWMSGKGYTFYQRVCSSSGDPSNIVRLYDARRQDASFPYALHGGPADDVSFRASTGPRVNVGYALDSQGRHVVMKAVLSGSEEYRILKHLQNRGVPSSIDSFHNIIPILDIIACEGHFLVIMPRWGPYPLEPGYKNMKEAFHFIHCLLKGLNFLHLHRIVHGDIKMDNILVNHMDAYNNDEYNSHRASLRTQGKLTYALFDFDGSTMFPQSADINDCRLSSDVSFQTYPSQRPDDTHQGEIDFNPFAFDVGMLGVLFCQQFQHLTPLAPMLAPLFDMMTTRNISRRFTASEALTFFEEQVQPLTPGLETISCCPRSLYEYYIRFDKFDRWQDLDPEFIEKWAKFREPPCPLHVRILHRFCGPHWRWCLVNYIRRFGRFIKQGGHLLFHVFSP